MEILNLSVYPTSLPKGSLLRALFALVGNFHRHALAGATTKALCIFSRLSKTLKDITRLCSVAVLRPWNGHLAGQQHIYAPVPQRPSKGMHTGSHLIRFSNGRTPYITKQVIF